ncbi:hypothetical protein H2248_012605 [Termitomyces sp. 'cryptogamus']|nr:hypothetical protein H2248_012605 [Termitomyces sp. 'cryptogamus']
MIEQTRRPKKEQNCGHRTTQHTLTLTGQRKTERWRPGSQNGRKHPALEASRLHTICHEVESKGTRETHTKRSFRKTNAVQNKTCVHRERYQTRGHIIQRCPRYEDHRDIEGSERKAGNGSAAGDEERNRSDGKIPVEIRRLHKNRETTRTA